jgi:GNAT superfamily N-acetyltransferase
MELGKSAFFKINNMNCEFRILHVSDVSKEYVDGLKEQTKYIINIPKNVSISSQKKYVKDVLCSKDDTICGLFINNKLVGTAGIQSSTLYLQYIEVPAKFVATIGIFLFDKDYRGMKLGRALVWAAIYLYHNCVQVEWFGAGMEKENIPSLKSFLSCGFNQVYKDEVNCRVLINYSELTKPEFIKDETLQDVN